jgi:hypothetical protein
VLGARRLCWLRRLGEAPPASGWAAALLLLLLLMLMRAGVAPWRSDSWGVVRQLGAWVTGEGRCETEGRSLVAPLARWLAVARALGAALPGAGVVRADQVLCSSSATVEADMVTCGGALLGQGRSRQVAGPGPAGGWQGWARCGRGLQ